MPEMYIAAGIAILICPLTLIPVIVAAIANKIAFRGRYWGFLIGALTGIPLFLLGYHLDTPIVPFMILQHLAVTVIPVLDWNDPRVDLKNWILSDLRTIGAAMVAEMTCLYLSTRTPERMLIEEEQRREQARTRIERPDLLPRKSQMVVGVSGSGKTALLGRSIETIIERSMDKRHPSSPCIIIIDCKASCEPHSLWELCSIIAKKYDKELIVINGTANSDLGDAVYDFLDGVKTSDAMLDLVMTLIENPSVKASAGSEHYRTITASYLLTIIEVMRDGQIDVTIHNLVSILDPADLTVAIDQFDIPSEEKDRVIRFAKANWNDVRANVEKLKMFLKGQGRKIFTGDGQRINLRKAYEKRAMLLIMASELDMPSLCSKLCQIGIMDLRGLVSARINGTVDMNDDVYVFMDEFSSISSSCVPLVRSLYQRARSARTSITLATQSVCDITAVDPAWLDEIVDNTTKFYCFRQNSQAACEIVAGIIGTEDHVASTMRTSNQHLTGEGSHTLDKSYVLHPDAIRRIPINHGYVLDKTGKDVRVQYFRNEFVRAE